MPPLSLNKLAGSVLRLPKCVASQDVETWHLIHRNIRARCSRSGRPLLLNGSGPRGQSPSYFARLALLDAALSFFWVPGLRRFVKASITVLSWSPSLERDRGDPIAVK